jgi:L-asparaginase II
MRSLTKIIQLKVALDFINKYKRKLNLSLDFSQQELALGCASHTGLPAQLTIIKQLALKLNVDPEKLACGCYRNDGKHLCSKVQHNCAGKHLFQLLAASLHDYYHNMQLDNNKLETESNVNLAKPSKGTDNKSEKSITEGNEGLAKPSKEKDNKNEKSITEGNKGLANPNKSVILTIQNLDKAGQYAVQANMNSVLTDQYVGLATQHSVETDNQYLVKKKFNLIKDTSELIYSYHNYYKPSHPLQIAIKKELSSLCKSELSEAIDGCRLPTYFLPAEKLAQGLAKISTNEKYIELLNIALEFPQLIGGNKQADSLIMAASSKTLWAKLGAEGLVAVINLKDQQCLLLKIADGAKRAKGIAAKYLLNKINWLADSKLCKIDHNLYDSTGLSVGELVCDF